MSQSGRRGSGQKTAHVKFAVLSRGTNGIFIHYHFARTAERIIEVDDHNYTLKKDLHKTVKVKNGKTMIPAYKTVGYFSSPAKDLDRLGEEIIRDRLSKPLNGLGEVAEAIREARAEWRELVKTVTEENR